MTSRTPDEQLTDLLRSLREETSDERPSPDVEARLMEAFRRQESASASSRARDPRAWPRQTARWTPAARWLAIAASVAFVVAAGVGMRTWLSPRSSGTSTVAGGERGALQPLQARVLRPDIDRSAAVMTTRPATGLRPVRTGARRTASPRSDVVEFLAWPGAGALPSLESGELIRVDLPAAVLPLLGLQGEARAGQQAVPADVIVGQDGRPRAVRLVSDER